MGGAFAVGVGAGDAFRRTSPIRFRWYMLGFCFRLSMAFSFDMYYIEPVKPFNGKAFEGKKKSKIMSIKT